MIKATNKAVTKEKDAKGNKSFVARALFANTLNAKVKEELGERCKCCWDSDKER